MKILAYIDFGTESNSGKHRKFLEFDYVVSPYGVGNALSRHHMMLNDPRVKVHEAQGYNPNAVQIATFEISLRDELYECQADLDRGGWIDSHQSKLESKLKSLTYAQKIYDAGMVEL
ncbi:MAG: hypothetical protein COA84_13965 [Robiginitomaculum sp.]|nr:MAG: hypothetical protein COA84_13965 [Robiginitomaculum sp.]